MANSLKMSNTRLLLREKVGFPGVACKIVRGSLIMVKKDDIGQHSSSYNTPALGLISREHCSPRGQADIDAQFGGSLVLSLSLLACLLSSNSVNAWFVV